MNVLNKVKIEEFLIEEIEWNNKPVVYINNKKFEGTFAEARQHVFGMLDAERCRMEPWTGDDSYSDES